MTTILPLVLVLGIEPPATAEPEAAEAVPEATADAPGAAESPTSDAPTGDAPTGEAAGELGSVDQPGAIEVETDEDRAANKEKQRKSGATGMPDAFATDDYGPFFEAEPVSEVKRPAGRTKHPPLSVGRGFFCFVDNATCKLSLIADSDVGAGVNIISAERGRDVPYTQFRTRFGMVTRPLMLARNKPWHPWGLGVVGSWSLGSGSIASTSGENEDSLDDVSELDPIDAWRVGVVNQLWLSQKRHSFHLEFTLGAINSPVLAAPGRYWGTTVEVGGTWGGWGGFVASADFLDGDTRIVFGARVHDVAAGPIIGLVLLGLLIGGAL